MRIWAGIQRGFGCCREIRTLSILGSGGNSGECATSPITNATTDGLQKRGGDYAQWWVRVRIEVPDLGKAAAMRACPA
jgi:hypothetical protein